MCCFCTCHSKHFNVWAFTKVVIFINFIVYVQVIFKAIVLLLHLSCLFIKLSSFCLSFVVWQFMLSNCSLFTDCHSVQCWPISWNYKETEMILDCCIIYDDPPYSHLLCVCKTIFVYELSQLSDTCAQEKHSVHFDGNRVTINTSVYCVSAYFNFWLIFVFSFAIITQFIL